MITNVLLFLLLHFVSSLIYCMCITKIALLMLLILFKLN